MLRFRLVLVSTYSVEFETYLQIYFIIWACLRFQTITADLMNGQAETWYLCWRKQYKGRAVIRFEI